MTKWSVKRKKKQRECFHQVNGLCYYQVHWILIEAMCIALFSPTNDMYAWCEECFETNLSGSMLSKSSLRFCFSSSCNCSLIWIHSDFVVNNIVSLHISRSFRLWQLASLHMTRWRFGFESHLDRNLNQYLQDKSPADQVSTTTIQCSTSNFSLLWDIWWTGIRFSLCGTLDFLDDFWAQFGLKSLLESKLGDYCCL